MDKWKTISLLALIFSVINLGVLYNAQSAKNHNFLSPEDYLEIQQLYSYYARDVDSGSQRDASWMYTDDGLWDVDGLVSWNGKDELKQHYTTLPPGVSKNGIRHFSTNLILVPTKDGVRGSAYMVGIERKEKDGPLEMNIMGKYEDLLVKTDKGWRFKWRKFQSDTWHGSDREVPPSPFVPELL